MNHNSEKRASIHQFLSHDLVDTIPALNVDIIHSDNPEETIKMYLAHPDVIYAEMDGVGYGGVDAPNDPMFDDQWALSKKHLDAIECWKSATGDGVIVAVLDSGFNFEHEDLRDIRTVEGYNFVAENDNTTDDHGHGSHCSGIIAGKNNNGKGITGLAYDATIMPVKVLRSDNSGMYSWWASAITFAVDNGAHILSMSLQGTGSSTPLGEAVQYAEDNGVFIAACNGNFHENGDPDSLPGLYATTLSVGNMDSNFNRYTSSSRTSFLDVVAPGSAILSTTLGNNYESWYGCSMATPYVAATAALLLELDPDLTPADLREILIITAIDLGDVGKDLDFGYGAISPIDAIITITGDSLHVAEISILLVFISIL